MFQDSLLDASDSRERQRLMRVVSFLLEALCLSIAVIVPLLQGVALPRIRDTFILPPPPRGSRVMNIVRGPTKIQLSGVERPDALVYSIHKPQHIAGMIRHEATDEPGFPNGLPGPLGSVPGDPNGVFAGVLPPTPTPPPPAHETKTTRLKVSPGVSAGFLVHRVDPAYPPIARAARVEGTVVLAAVIARDGSIENLRALSGPAMLVGAAVDAVSQWHYRPYRLGDQPVEVETQITVNFRLQR